MEEHEELAQDFEAWLLLLHMGTAAHHCTARIHCNH
jgi:hypothetical protein